MDAANGAPDDSGIDHERVVDHQILPVVIRSTPRYGRFLWIGVIGGLVVAVVLTWVASLREQPGGVLSTGASGVLWVFAVYAAAAVGIGLLLMGVLVLFLTRMGSRRTRTVSAVHDTTLVFDLQAPVNDDMPRWALDAEDLAPGARRIDPDDDPPARRRPRA